MLNQHIPASIFLPPADVTNIHFVGSHDYNGLNTGIFYLRVHPWSIAMLIDAMAMPLYRPDIKLGRSADQEAMRRTLNKTVGGPYNKGFKSAQMYVPRLWINTYEFSKGSVGRFEGQKGDMLVHFPGMEETKRLKLMTEWLDIVERDGNEWEVPIEQTKYWNETRQFWDRFRDAQKLVADFKRNDTVPNISLEDATHRLQLVLQEQAENKTAIEAAMLDVRQRTPSMK